ncbi:hypothetical protein [Microvirga terricola]|uniref:Oxidoreductase molybdopterin-binding domain-containing protein n=1 Tax=Microvirga terricola TaxID=2719797 RepID=A0ABX0VCP7_9HYPH|nr:hypothetical protein [Microvirga terricola]NIX77618.1 hypothetical protein [Microvirga terricola]
MLAFPQKILTSKRTLLYRSEGPLMRMALYLFLVALMGVGEAALASEPLPAPTGPVILTISGKIEQTNAPGEARFDKAMLEALGSASITTSSEVSDKAQFFEGVPLRAVIERIGGKGATMKATALNDYTVDIPLEDLKYEPLLALRVDGQVLKVRDKGPIWIIYPRDSVAILKDVRFNSRWVWQLSRLHIE